MQQPDLFAGPLFQSALDPAPFQRHSPTSRLAATAIEPDLGRLQAEVLEHILRCGGYGATDQEAQDALGLDPSTQRPRRVELANLGLIRPSGTRKTRSGRAATVWVKA